jgi:hypothetical protein
MLLLILAIAVTVPAAGQETWSYTYKLKLTVSADGPVSDAVMSALTKSFRSIDGVKLVDDETPDHELHVVAVVTSSGSIAAGVTLTSHNDDTAVLFFSNVCTPTEAQVRDTAEMLKYNVVLDDMWVFISPSASALAVRISDAIDVHHIEPDRRLITKIHDKIHDANKARRRAKAKQP